MRTRDKRQARCRIIRDYFGKTVADVAKEADVSEKTVYRYETKTFKKVTDEIKKCSIWYNEHIIQFFNEDQSFNSFMEV